MQIEVLQVCWYRLLHLPRNDHSYYCFELSWDGFLNLVPQARLELAHLAVPASKTGVSTNSTIGAILYLYYKFGGPGGT